MSLTAADRRRDIEWSRDVRERDGHRCRRCGRDGHVEAAHIFPRRVRATRWDLNNGLTLCAGPRGEETCHEWGHAHPREFLLWAAEQLGAERFGALRDRALTVAKRVPRPVR
jgi:hypothetical protein